MDRICLFSDISGLVYPFFPLNGIFISYFRSIGESVYRYRYRWPKNRYRPMHRYRWKKRIGRSLPSIYSVKIEGKYGNRLDLCTRLTLWHFDVPSLKVLSRSCLDRNCQRGILSICPKFPKKFGMLENLRRKGTPKLMGNMSRLGGAK